MCSTIASSGDVLIDRDGLFPSLVISVSSERSLGGKLASRQDEPLAPYDKPLRPRSTSGRQRTLRCGGQPITAIGTAVGCGGVVIGSGSGQAG
ncbi:hypothetical protein ACSZNB_00305 [Aeromonas hydrophila]|uniref:hypothetical protein n=1 Tax=Aeromonas hydrophila TaxID=644 RepID=UPI002B46C850|nr:hypothetical protein [Aeromonas hydrophila]